jgi:hypothetical protein
MICVRELRRMFGSKTREVIWGYKKLDIQIVICSLHQILVYYATQTEKTEKRFTECVGKTKQLTKFIGKSEG